MSEDDDLDGSEELKFVPDDSEELVSVPDDSVDSSTSETVRVVLWETAREPHLRFIASCPRWRARVASIIKRAS